MFEFQNHANKGNTTQAAAITPAIIDNLIAALADGDWMTHQRARESLVDIGRPAVVALTGALENSDEQVRWQAAKALSEICDPAAARALVRALEDESFGVRWLAAEGLICLGCEGLVPLLEALVCCSDSTWLREGARHVLRTLAGEGLHTEVAPVLNALEDIEPAIEVIQPAKAALNAFESAKDLSPSGKQTTRKDRVK